MAVVDILAESAEAAGKPAKAGRAKVAATGVRAEPEIASALAVQQTAWPAGNVPARRAVSRRIERRHSPSPQPGQQPGDDVLDALDLVLIALPLG